MNSQFAWWAIIAAVLIGHFGLNVGVYNRINGFGWPRKLIKTIEYCFLLLTVALPPVVAFLYGDLIADLAGGRAYLTSLPASLLAYGLVCLLSWFALGIPWLLWRPIFGLEWIRAKRQIEIVDAREQSEQPLGLTVKCKLAARIPLNQIFELSIERIDLPVAGLPQALDGYRIAHLSDIHLTGYVHPDFSRYAVQRKSVAARHDGADRRHHR